MKYTINIDGSGADEMLRGVRERKKWLEERTQEFVKRLADYGEILASAAFSGAAYDGTNDVSVTIEERGDMAKAVVATGEAVLFIEFGAGSLLGYGHPDVQGYGPGTYPGKGHWDDPKGWWIPGTGQHTYGNPPAAAMYNARKQVEEDLTTIAREVFSH